MGFLTFLGGCSFTPSKAKGINGTRLNKSSGTVIFCRLGYPDAELLLRMRHATSGVGVLVIPVLLVLTPLKYSLTIVHCPSDSCQHN
jgi:hypothetical protein